MLQPLWSGNTRATRRNRARARRANATAMAIQPSCGLPLTSKGRPDPPGVENPSFCRSNTMNRREHGDIGDAESCSGPRILAAASVIIRIFTLTPPDN